MKNKFITARKFLTPYTLACGYIETSTEDNGYQVTLCDNMGIGYDVKVYDSINHVREYWETYETLTEARKIFMQLIKQYKLKRVIPNE